VTRQAAILVLACAPVLAQAQTSLTDFARGAEIRAEGGGSIFRVLLPDDVYDTVTRFDLADIRVLNAAGDAVPHMLREVPRPADPEAEWRAVPSFPMTEALAGATAKTQVRIGADGTVLKVLSDTATGQATTAYLVDTSGIEEPITRMALSWEAPAGLTFLARVSVLRSDDLDDWRTLVSSAAVAQLQRDTYALTQNEIELPIGQRTKYLRISWPKELAVVTLKSVRVRPRTTETERAIRWRSLTAERVGPPNAAQYDARGLLPVEYVDLEFVDPVDAAQVTIRSRFTSSSQWVSRHAGVFYALQDSNGAIRNVLARIAATSDRYWTVETNRDGGWKADRVPRLKVGWHPHELLFLAQGAGPYELVYGSARVGAADAPVGALLASLSEADRAGRVRLATLGESRSLGGADALKPALPLRQIVLWSVLVAAVAALAFLAMRLFRDTEQPG
jgi:Protein of unknown function (DUF3999)